MGTPALIIIKEAELGSKTLIRIVAQSDGYPTGIGEDIRKSLGHKLIGNGYSDRNSKIECAGMGCAAASLVKDLKKAVGGIYVVADSNWDFAYKYILWQDGSKIMMKTCDWSGKALNLSFLSDLSINIFSRIESDQDSD